MNRRQVLKTTAAAGLALVTAGCGRGTGSGSGSGSGTGNRGGLRFGRRRGPGDIAGLIAADERFSTLAAAVRAAGLTGTLQAPGPYTLFAPTNEAFAALPQGTMESLMLPANREMLIRILSYHLVPGRHGTAEYAGQAINVPTVEGNTLFVDGTQGGLIVNNARVTEADIAAANGIVHAVDTVLLP